MSTPHRPPPRAHSSRVRTIGVADVGSNSTHLLVAATDGVRVEPLADVSEPIDLGATISRRGDIGKSLTRKIASTLAGFRERARDLGAEGIAVVATEPLRRAGDRIEAARRIVEQYGASVAALTHEEEALLTVLGLRHDHDRSAPLIVADVGGGSTEAVLLSPSRAPRAVGVSIGSATLTDEIDPSDPPRAKEWRALRARADSALRTVGALQASRVVFAGGTATNLLKLSRSGLIRHELSRSDLALAGEVLAGTPASRVATAYGISPRRARLLPAGLAIFEALIRHTEAEEATVDRGGIREGLVIAIARAGVDWREELATLVAGPKKSSR